MLKEGPRPKYPRSQLGLVCLNWGLCTTSSACLVGSILGMLLPGPGLGLLGKRGEMGGVSGFLPPSRAL